MGDFRLVTLTNQESRFYSLLGPYLARRDIVGQMGGPLYDDEGKLWWVAFAGDELAGFAAVVLGDDEAHFCSDYVLPAYRRQGLHTQLITARLAHVAGHAKRATATATIAGQFAYKKLGFTLAKSAQRPMKNFQRLEKSL